MRKGKKGNFIFFVIVFFALAAILFFVEKTSAQGQAEGVTIAPPIFDLSLAPGESRDQIIKITNPTEDLIELYPSAENFVASGEEGKPEFVSAESEEKFSIAKWITFDVPKIAILPRQEIEFHFKMHIPQDAEPGGHYGVVFFSTQPPSSEGKASQVSLVAKIGALILVKTPGDISERGDLLDFSGQKFYFRPPAIFTTLLGNSGNVHFKPKGEITIRNWRGKEMTRLSFNNIGGNVLPESRRKFEDKWNAASSPFWKIPVGRFTADLRLVYGHSDNVLAGKIHFWIIPWWVIVASIFLFFAIIVYFIKRKRKRKIINKTSSVLPSEKYHESSTPDSGRRKI